MMRENFSMILETLLGISIAILIIQYCQKMDLKMDIENLKREIKILKKRIK